MQSFTLSDFRASNVALVAPLYGWHACPYSSSEYQAVACVRVHVRVALMIEMLVKVVMVLAAVPVVASSGAEKPQTCQPVVRCSCLISRTTLQQKLLVCCLWWL